MVTPPSSHHRNDDLSARGYPFPPCSRLDIKAFPPHIGYGVVSRSFWADLCFPFPSFSPPPVPLLLSLFDSSFPLIFCYPARQTRSQRTDPPGCLRSGGSLFATGSSHPQRRSFSDSPGWRLILSQLYDDGPNFAVSNSWALFVLRTSRSLPQ